MQQIIVPSFKVIFIGCGGVGKTSIISRKKTNTFQLIVDPTVGAGRTSIEIEVDNKKADLCIWDTAGQERYAPLIPIFVRDTHVAVIVASYTDYQSIDKIDYWLEALRNNSEDPVIFVAINKIDMASSVSEPINDLANRLGTKYANLFFVSAKSGDNIDSLFESVAMSALNLLKAEETTTDTKVDLENNKSKQNTQKGKGCC